LKATEKLAIHELLGRAAFGLDQRKPDVIEQCFAADATFTLTVAGNNKAVLEGRDAIMQLMTDTMAAHTEQRRHVISNMFFESAEKTSARVVSSLVVFSINMGEIKPITSGIYQDIVVRENGDWKISKRHLDLDLTL
jgi:3-phenylpropionate/cinnamic acid dioxygenase small subunit